MHKSAHVMILTYKLQTQLSNLNASWRLPRPPTTSGRDLGGMMTRPSSPEDDANRLDVNSQQRKRVFVPISDQFGASRSAFARPGGGSHWSLLLWEVSVATYHHHHSEEEGVGGAGGGCRRSAYYSVESAFHHFDSCSGSNSSAAQSVARKLRGVMGASASGEEDGRVVATAVMERRVPQQGNGHDCGAFALGFAEALSDESEAYADCDDCVADNGRGGARYEDAVRTYFEGNGGLGGTSRRDCESASGMTSDG